MPQFDPRERAIHVPPRAAREDSAVMASSVSEVPRLQILPAALSRLSLRQRSCGSWIEELRRQKAGNWEGFNPSCHWTRRISERAHHRAESLDSAAVEGRQPRGRSRIPCAPSPCSNCSPLNQLSVNDGSYPGFPLESSLLLDWTPTTGLQLTIVYMLNSTA